MSLFLIWIIGALVTAVIGFGLIGLGRRAVGWRSANWTIFFAILWPLLVVALIGAVLLIICAMIRELGDEDPFWRLG